MSKFGQAVRFVCVEFLTKVDWQLSARTRGLTTVPLLALNKIELYYWLYKTFNGCPVVCLAPVARMTFIFIH